MRSFLRRLAADTAGQSLIECAMIMPLFIVLVLGVSEVGWALLDQHAASRLTREGSNLISRDTPLQDAAQVLRTMTSRPINFDSGASKVIFSVLKRGETTGTANYDRIILYQRHQIGSFGGNSKLATAGTASFGAAPDYQAVNSDSNTSLRVTNVPADLIGVRGGLLYVTEIYTRHDYLTPLNRFGITIPQTLYSVAYF